MKTCPHCGNTKPEEKFSSNKRNPDGLSYYCRICNAKKQREWKRANPEKIRLWKQRYLEQQSLRS